MSQNGENGNGTCRKRSARANNEQKERLINFMETHRELAFKHFSPSFTHAKGEMLWKVLASDLNAWGPRKTVAEWKKTWLDMRSKARAQKAALNKSQKKTGGGRGISTNVVSDNSGRIVTLAGGEVSCLGNRSVEEFGINDDVARQFRPSNNAPSASRAVPSTSGAVPSTSKISLCISHARNTDDSTLNDDLNADDWIFEYNPDEDMDDPEPIEDEISEDEVLFGGTNSVPVNGNVPTAPAENQGATPPPAPPMQKATVKTEGRSKKKANNDDELLEINRRQTETPSQFAKAFIEVEEKRLEDESYCPQANSRHVAKETATSSSTIKSMKFL